MARAGRWGLAALVFGAVLVLDQLSKAWAVGRLPGDPVVVIDGWLEFVYAENTGFAFGLFHGSGVGGVISLVAVAAIVAMVVLVSRSERVWEIVGSSLVAGGAAGNLVDRLLRGDGLAEGSVVDFVKIPLIPNFNVADVALTTGVILLLLLSVRAEAHAR
jgi:signal peptidase II